MRSKTLCLLICLISSLPTAKAGGLFCDTKRAGTRNDCEDKPISLKDFKWDLSTSFDERKAVPKFEDVEIDMHRALYIEYKGNDIEMVFKPVDKDQCKLVLLKKDQRFTVDDFSSTSKTETTVKVNTAEKTIIVAVFEPNCRLTAKRDKRDVEAEQMAHIFMRNIPTLNMPNTILDEQLDQNIDRALGNFIDVHGSATKLGYKIEGLFPDKVVTPNLFYPYEQFVKPYMEDKTECNHLCKFGKVFEFNLLERINFANTFKLSSTCEWMTIHLTDTSIHSATEISLRHGFVILAGELRAYPMDFERTPAKSGYDVIVTYYVDEENDSHITIANRHGKAVHKSKIASSTKTTTFAFSNDDCLDDFIGAKVVDDSEGKAKAQGFEFNDDLNLGYLAATQTGWSAVRYVEHDAKKDPETENYRTGEAKNVFGETGKKYTAPPFKEVSVNTVNEENTRETVGQGTSAPNADAPATFVSKETMDQVKRELDEQEAQKRKINEILLGNHGKTYKYWAIPAGFATGSFASFLIANIILFVFKRTVFTFWYKAMYKRYGSDTTMGAGTTMGKTAAGETIGGGTTMGGTTMGGTTAGGETTGSTTAA